jgi:hypothetical protein
MILPLNIPVKAIHVLLILCTSGLTSSGFINTDSLPKELIEEIITAINECHQDNKSVLEGVLQ